MLTFTRKTNYALVALARLAKQLADEGEPLSARQIAEEFSLPPGLLMNVLKDLQKAGVVSATRGARGGYYLAMSPDRISIADVLVATEGPVRLTRCSGGDGGADKSTKCPAVRNCPISTAIKHVNERVYGFLEELSLEDLVAWQANAPEHHMGAAI